MYPNVKQVYVWIYPNINAPNKILANWLKNHFLPNIKHSKKNTFMWAYLSSVQWSRASADVGRILLSLQSLKNDLWKDSAYVSLWEHGVVINLTYCSSTSPRNSLGSMEACGSTFCIVCNMFKAITVFNVLSPAFIPAAKKIIRFFGVYD